MRDDHIMCATGGLSTRVFLRSHNHTAGQAGSATHFFNGRLTKDLAFADLSL